MQIADLVEQHFLQARLRAARHVVMKRRQLGSRHPRRPAQPLGQRLGEHPRAREEIEALGVEREAAAGAVADDGAHGGEQAGLAVRSQPHDLVLVGIHPEAEIRGDRRVEEPERIGELDLLEEREVGVLPPTIRGGRPLADAVHGQDRGLGESGEVKGARRVGGVMLEGVDPPLEAEHLSDLALGPVGVEPRPAVVAAPRPQLATQLLHRRFVERHAVDIADVEATGLQAEGEGRHRQPRVVLDAREALFLGRRHQPAVLAPGNRPTRGRTPRCR